MTNLRAVLHAWLAHKELTIREGAKLIGVSSATLWRIQRGHEMDTKTFMKLMNWFMK